MTKRELCQLSSQLHYAIRLLQEQVEELDAKIEAITAEELDLAKKVDQLESSLKRTQDIAKGRAAQTAMLVKDVEELKAAK
ncbi:hypothetical protein [Pseudomonas fluorescens]|uniref:Cell division protein ZapB n=2 Tax=Pseudomonas fluorescens TaxID=294 RepID=A0ABY1TIP0_PSEFL|nr:hypothetical protein [Pseudomonas fluorescens]MCI4606894.1 hypothetical protein [Pseudomonas fluorescens]PQB02265.1 hypothetical protein B0A76_02860 [Pseudomonas fluorescens]RFP95755.1 hypothetical protein D0N73_12915 [Pseudomonas fluorescens]SNY13269.1 hypothetical protein SAMN04488487_5427 [Pseudomonas fluorescens]SQF91881.1 Uncharacterised protein [Pseudomonas fluorescens]